MRNKLRKNSLRWARSRKKVYNYEEGKSVSEGKNPLSQVENFWRKNYTFWKGTRLKLWSMNDSNEPLLPIPMTTIITITILNQVMFSNNFRHLQCHLKYWNRKTKLKKLKLKDHFCVQLSRGRNFNCLPFSYVLVEIWRQFCSKHLFCQ